MHNHTLVRNAHVEVRDIQHADRNRQGTRTIKHQAEITVNGQFTHRFPATSRVSKHLQLMDTATLSSRLSGGSFFFVDDALIDFRDGQYNGFVHTDDAVDRFMELLGAQPRSLLPLHRRRTTDQSNGGDFVLRKVWANSEIEVPGYQSGAEFTSQLSFVWNPFVHTINAAFDLVRLLCSNGMVGLTSLFNVRVPVVNRWAEHLDIAATQIQNKVNRLVIDNVDHMATSRANVADVMLINSHLTKRLEAKHPSERNSDVDVVNRLAAMAQITDARQFLSTVYNPNVFTDSAVASQLPSHLTMFDLYNIATEARTHTIENPSSTNFALDRISNDLMFGDRPQKSSLMLDSSQIRACSFADPERAFYGLDA